jgi:hypothetical protein
MLMLLLCACPLLSKPDKDGVFRVHVSDNSTVSLNTAKIGMALFGLSLLSGLLNSHFFSVSTTIPDRATRLRWRMHIYFLKGMMTLALTPLLEKLLDFYFETSGMKIAAQEKRQTAAVTRCYITLLLAAIGSYCKLIREDAAAKKPAAAVVGPTSPKRSNADASVAAANSETRKDQ